MSSTSPGSTSSRTGAAPAAAAYAGPDGNLPSAVPSPAANMARNRRHRRKRRRINVDGSSVVPDSASTVQQTRPASAAAAGAADTSDRQGDANATPRNVAPGSDNHEDSGQQGSAGQLQLYQHLAPLANISLQTLSPLPAQIQQSVEETASSYRKLQTQLHSAQTGLMSLTRHAADGTVPTSLRVKGPTIGTASDRTVQIRVNALYTKAARDTLDLLINDKRLVIEQLQQNLRDLPTNIETAITSLHDGLREMGSVFAAAMSLQEIRRTALTTFVHAVYNTDIVLVQRRMKDRKLRTAKARRREAAAQLRDELSTKEVIDARINAVVPSTVQRAVNNALQTAAPPRKKPGQPGNGKARATSHSGPGKRQRRGNRPTKGKRPSGGKPRTGIKPSSSRNNQPKKKTPNNKKKRKHTQSAAARKKPAPNRQQKKKQRRRQ